MRLRGTISQRHTVTGRIAGESTITGALNAPRGLYPDYAGPYEADALFSAQVFSTQSKVMARDFKVNAINYTEAPNEYGTTVTIGG